MVDNIWNIKRKTHRKPCSLFYVEPAANNKNIYNIKTLINYVIVFEAPHQRRKIPQYLNCQRYEHTKLIAFGNIAVSNVLESSLP